MDEEKIITKFLLNTCTLRPRLTIPAIQAAAFYVALACGRFNVDGYDWFWDKKMLVSLTGSVAEFYIEPMLRHIGDIDVMFHFSTELAIPRGYPPPTQLPAEFHNYVKVYEIIDSDLPGYVFLPLRYALTECVDDGKYDVIECYGEYLSFSKTGDNTHGPAVSIHVRLGNLSVDAVDCVRCLVWPSQAADWPTRHRNYGLSLIHI